MNTQQLNFVERMDMLIIFLEEEFTYEVLMIKILASDLFKSELQLNAPIQGSAADIIRLAMFEIDRITEKEKLNEKMLLQIHDELSF